MKKREFLKTIVFVGLAYLLKPFESIAKKNHKKISSTYPFILPSLSYSFQDLEPYIDRRTMEIHYTKHHQTYIDKLNESIVAHVELQNKSLEDMFSQVSKLPIAIRNHGGGHYNHSFFWTILTPHSGKKPEGELRSVIEKNYESFDTFKSLFTKTALDRFGSGWVWLITDEYGSFQIISTPNQDNPLMDTVEKKGVPLLALDVWEHAYYLNYQNRRKDYIEAFWNIVNWDQVEVNYKKAIHS